MPGTAVYLTRDPNGVPHALLHNLKHNKVLHERVVFLAMFTDATARVPDEERVTVDALSPDVLRG